MPSHDRTSGKLRQPGGARPGLARQQDHARDDQPNSHPLHRRHALAEEEPPEQSAHHRSERERDGLHLRHWPQVERAVEAEHARGPGHQAGAKDQLQQRRGSGLRPIAGLDAPRPYDQQVHRPQHRQRHRGADGDGGDRADAVGVQDLLGEELADPPAQAGQRRKHYRFHGQR
jgi:hypothetical protein